MKQSVETDILCQLTKKKLANNTAKPIYAR